MEGIAIASLDRPLTVAETAALLRVSPWTIYALCKAGKLPHLRVGLGRGSIRIKKDALDCLQCEGVENAIGIDALERIKSL